jgi:CRP-like cAMP-binding protein
MARRRTPVELQVVDPASCSVDLRLQILRGVPFFAGLPPDAVAAVNRLFRERGYQPGDTIYRAGEPASALFVVAAGNVKLLRHTPAGQDVLLDLLAPGELFGSLTVLGDAEYRESAQAHTMCCALGITAADFQTVLRRYPPVALAVLDVVSTRLQAAQDQISGLSAAPAEARVAATLLRLGAKLGQEHDGQLLIQLPLARQDLAAMSGTTTETTSRILSQLRAAGIVASGRQWVAIRDRARLADLASAAS